MQKRLADRTPFYYGWVILGAAGSAMFVRNAAASLTIAVFVYPLYEDLGWSRTLISGAAAAGGLAATFASPLVGNLIDRYGARAVLTASIFLLCITTALLRWSDITLTVMGATIPWVFYIGYGTGRVIFSSPVQIGAAVVVSRWFIRLRGRTNGILNMSHSVGMVLFPLIASIVIAQSGWRDAWLVLAVLTFAAALLPVAILISERPEDLGLRPDGDAEEEPDATDSDSATQSEADEEPEWTADEAKRTPTLWLLALATGLLFLMQAGTNTHSAAFFQDQGLGAVIAGFGISFNAIFLGVGSVAWGVIVEKSARSLRNGSGRCGNGSGVFSVHHDEHRRGSAGILRPVRLRPRRHAHRAAGRICRLLRQGITRHDSRHYGTLHHLRAGGRCHDPWNRI